MPKFKTNNFKIAKRAGFSFIFSHLVIFLDLVASKFNEWSMIVVAEFVGIGGVVFLLDSEKLPEGFENGQNIEDGFDQGRTWFWKLAHAQAVIP